ncbi:cyclic nucleotide-binding protein [Pseudodesulfovibrio mercurii]|uniref:Cyclic nucleotide-binding protein n=1 Tax=Pseudodesulfovibrio mercurii TaxID=641491 RepID=F0JGQ8_9BACT|nr:SulP family inorganic anion transporter [Pseudodesulfovibrio mercurii]EGB13927.1 cyclic nucleotide-binding protein [Pseudodesulfovibrio mercurii]
MAIFQCDSCGYERIVQDLLTGQRARCPGCGRVVTIAGEGTGSDAAGAPVDADSSREVGMAESDGPVVREAASDPLPAGGDGVPLAPVDPDDGESEVDLQVPEDVICAACGHVQEPGHGETCSGCGAMLKAVEALPEVDESEIDVSDLAEIDEPQVWDADFQGDGDGASLEETEDPDRWRLLRGGKTLNLYAGIVSGVLSLFFVYALSLLAASQAGMHQYLPFLLGTALTGVIVGSIFYSFLSRIPFALVGPETVLTAVLFLFLGSMYRQMAETLSPELILPTLMAGIAVAALLTGLSLLVLGRFRLGEYIRFLPLQVIGGVIGGVGVFVLLGAFAWMGGLSLDWSNVYSLALSLGTNFDLRKDLYTMGPSVIFGLILFFAMFRTKNSLFLVALILVAVGAGNAASIWGTNPALRDLAVPVPFPEGSLLVHLQEVLRSPMLFSDIQWSVIKSHGLYIGAMVVLAVFTVMFRITRLEFARGRGSDLNREYAALGVTNMVSGLCCGMPVSLSYGRSAGSYGAGGRGPLAGIVAGLVCASGLFYADYVLPMIPRFVPEGLLVYAGLDLIRDWGFRTKSSFTSRSELWLLRLTFAATILLGLLEGIGFAVALALMVTVGRVSRGGVVRNELSGSQHTSNVDRAPAQQRVLREYGDHIHIMRLQGFVFLGSMERLIQAVRRRLDDRGQLSLEYLVLDFRLAQGFASASSLGFAKLYKLAVERGIQVVITSAPLELESHLVALGYAGDEEGLFRTFFNLDYALEWCENRVLDGEGMLEMKQKTLPELLVPIFPEPRYIPALMKVLKRETVRAGEAVFRQGDSSDSMFFVESGRLDVELELPDGRIIRLKKVGPGAVFGEMGIYTLSPRSATIRAAEPCVLYRMTLHKLDAIEERVPRLVTAINRFLINLLSERLADSNARVRELML